MVMYHHTQLQKVILSVVHVCVYVYYMCGDAQGDLKEASDPLDLELLVVGSCVTRGWELNSGPVEEQQVTFAGLRKCSELDWVTQVVRNEVRIKPMQSRFSSRPSGNCPVL